MIETSSPIDRRAQLVAAFGFVLQLASFGILLGTSYWASSYAIAATARFAVIGLPIWLVLYLIFKQMLRVDAENLETTELKRAQEAGASSAIFEVDDETLLLEQNRLKWLIRWMLPAVTVVLALYVLAGHFLGWGWTLGQSLTSESFKRCTQPTLMMWFIVGVGFLNFLYARYALALAKLPEWKLLRAGAACMAGTALACLGLAIGLMAGTSLIWAEPLLAVIIRIALILIGIEFAINFILDFYRPRSGLEIARPSFESRLLGLISEPGGLAKSVAEAVNYQFGFEVSSTWFYQLLQRWMFPIMVATILVVLALSSVVIVDAEEQVVVERFGRLVHSPREVLDPGLHFKLPYPIDIVHRAPVRRISEARIGEASEDEAGRSSKPILWTEAHAYIPELTLLVASPPDEGSTDAVTVELEKLSAAGESVPVSLLLVSLPIEYRIKDIKKYLYTYQDPVKVMESVVYQYMSDFGARVNMDELLGPGRETFNRDLRENIQERLDELDVGLEVAFAGFQAIHPPARDGVAKAFLSVIAAQTRMEAMINAAQGEQLKILTSVAGTTARANELDAAIVRRDALRTTPGTSAEQSADADQQVEDLMIGNSARGIPPLGGEGSARIADARAQAATRIGSAASKVRKFTAEVAAYEAAPALYKQRQWIGIYEDIDTIRKFLIAGDPSNVIIIYETQGQGGLDRVLSDAITD